MLVLLVDLLLIVINLLIVILIVQAVLSWLIAFEVVSRRQPAVDTIWRFTRALTDPMLRPIRRFIPPVSGVDLSPIVLFLILFVIARLIPMLLLGQPW